MKATFSKSILAGAFAVASLFAGSAQAQAVYPDFIVQKPGTGTSTSGQFTADKIVSNYIERIAFTGTGVGTGTFTVDLFFDLENFISQNGTLSVDNTGLNSAYDAYGFYTATGTFGPNSTGNGTTFTFLPGAGSALSVYLDRNNDTTRTSGSGVVIGDYSNRSDDTLIATGVGIAGEGNLTPTSFSCTVLKAECGSFGSLTSFELTNQGGGFFIDPKPFYNLSIQRGQLNNFPLTGTQIVNGSMDITFEEGARVPEPASLGLLGLGLLGLGAARRRKQAK